MVQVEYFLRGTVEGFLCSQLRNDTFDWQSFTRWIKASGMMKPAPAQWKLTVLCLMKLVLQETPVVAIHVKYISATSYEAWTKSHGTALVKPPIARVMAFAKD